METEEFSMSGMVSQAEGAIVLALATTPCVSSAIHPKKPEVHKQPLKVCISCFAGSVSPRLLNAFQAAECWLHREQWFGCQFGRAALIELGALRRLLDSAPAATASANFVSVPALFKIIWVVQHRLNVQLQCVVMRCLLKFYRQPLV